MMLGVLLCVLDLLRLWREEKKWASPVEYWNTSLCAVPLTTQHHTIYDGHKMTWDAPSEIYGVTGQTFKLLI
jgi:hypothetical protein